MSRLFIFILLLSISLSFAARSSGGGNYGRGGGGNYGGGTHTYPQSTGYSGNRPTGTQTHSYPSGPGLSGNRNTGNYRTEVHHHYHYNPPQQINYGSQHLPVYQHPPPTYVYEYRNSGSRFDTLLTGLALYNLGRMSSHHDHYDDRYRDYRSNSGETCKLGVSKTNGEYEETRIDCKLMSSFIWDADKSKTNEGNKVITTNTVTVTNVTHLNLNASDSDNSTKPEQGISVTVTNTTTVVDALQVKGPSLEVKPGMNCYMIRISRDSSILKRKVDCGILQTYAVQSLHYYNKAGHLTSYLIVTALPLFVFYFS